MEAAALHTGNTEFASRGVILGGYFARPEGEGPFPGLLVIHEAFGLNDNIRDITRRFAGQGYAALAVDLFANRSRVMCMFRLFSGMVLNSTEHGGIQDLKAALSHLASMPGVDPERLGAVGYCMGGSLAIALACADRRVRAIAPYYAMNPRPLEAVRRSCPVVGSYPGSDFTASAGRKLDEKLEAYNTPHEIKIYPGAKHSFFNDRLPGAYDAKAAQDSWERVLRFFEEYV